MCSSSHSMVLRVKRYWDMTSHIFSWSVYYEQKSLCFMSRCGCSDRVNVSKLLLIDWYRVGLMNNLIVWGQASLYKLSGRMCELDSCFHLNCYYWLIVISCKYNFNCLKSIRYKQFVSRSLLMSKHNTHLITKKILLIRWLLNFYLDVVHTWNIKCYLLYVLTGNISIATT